MLKRAVKVGGMRIFMFLYYEYIKYKGLVHSWLGSKRLKGSCGKEFRKDDLCDRVGKYSRKLSKKATLLNSIPSYTRFFTGCLLFWDCLCFVILLLL